MSSPVFETFPQDAMDAVHEDEFYEYASDAPCEHTVNNASDAPSEHTMHSIDDYAIERVPQNTRDDTDEYASDELTTYVASIVNPKLPTTDPTDQNAYNHVIDHFLFLLRAQGGNHTSSDYNFTDIYYFLKSRPSYLAPSRSKFFEFGAEYSHETRLRWVKDAAFNTLGSMNVYERVRCDYNNTAQLFLQPQPSICQPRTTAYDLVAKEDALNEAKTDLLEWLDRLRADITSLMNVVRSEVYWGDAYSHPPATPAALRYGMGFVPSDDPVDLDEL